jgi:hypothetical protein
MKEEAVFDYPLWRAGQPLRTFKIVDKQGNTEFVDAHEPVVGESTPTLRLIKYAITEVEFVKETGGTKNKKSETIKKDEPIVDMVAAYHAGEWVYFVVQD